MMDVAITKKQHIINTAADLFKEKGYTATSIRDLASKVGLEPSSIYSHIKSKEDLLTEICQSCATRFSNGMNEIYFQDITERKKIKALFHLHLEIAYDIPASITVFNDEWKFLHDDAKADFMESRKDYDKKFKKILTDGKKNGKFSSVGEDKNREGLVKTPERAAKAIQFLTQGYQQDADQILRSAVFKEDYNETVVVKDIEFYSMCEHHLLPFFGKAHVAYIPNGYVVGLSKIPRVIDVFARRMQVQERLTHEILHAIDDALKPLGVAVVIEAAHMCMMMRGVQKQNSTTTTSPFTGEFRNIETRNEFLSLIASRFK